MRSLLFRAGYELVPVGTDIDLHVKRLLTQLGVRTVLDVGANQGQYGTWLRRIGYTGRIVSFEPMAEPFTLLSRAAATDPAWSALRMAAGAEEGRVSMHVTANSVSSSLLAPTNEQVAAAPESAEVRREDVDVRRLDDVVTDIDVTGPVWLKIDTQGFEQQVLDGSSRLLEQVAAVQCEVSLTELYEGQADYLSVLHGCRHQDFAWCGRSCLRRTGVRQHAPAGRRDDQGVTDEPCRTATRSSR